MADDEREETVEIGTPEAIVNNETQKTSDKSPQASSENVSYDESGDAIFTDPTTKSKYKWDKATSQWKPLENEHYTWCSETLKWIPKASTENEFYRWCETTSQWVPKMSQETGKEGVVYGYDEKEGCHTYTDKDGAVFFFDKEKKAWFPKVDDDFLAVYQMNYGFIDNTTKPTVEDQTMPEATNDDDDDEVLPAEPSTAQKLPESGVGKKRKLPAEPPKWFEVAPEQNTKVYVSNLPLDITEEEFAEFMAKCGMVMKDLKSQKLKLRLYRDDSGDLKGDGLCHYIKVSLIFISASCKHPYETSR